MRKLLGPASRWIFPVLIAGSFFASGYMVGTSRDYARWQRLAAQAQDLQQQVAHLRLSQESRSQITRPNRAYTVNLYYHSEEDGNMVIHGGGPWSDDCRRIPAHEPTVAQEVYYIIDNVRFHDAAVTMEAPVQITRPHLNCDQRIGK
jgi:hypothetical protein